MISKVNDGRISNLYSLLYSPLPPLNFIEADFKISGAQN